jgi:hypothetical protein
MICNYNNLYISVRQLSITNVKLTHCTFVGDNVNERLWDVAPCSLLKITNISEILPPACKLFVGDYAAQRLVEWLTLLLRILEVSFYNLGLESCYSEIFSCFSSAHPGKCQDSNSKLGHERCFPNPS